MDKKSLKSLLAGVASGKLSPEKALDVLKHLPYEDIGMAKIDHHRNLRQGIPEVIFARGKRPEDVVKVARAMYKRAGGFIITKADKNIFEKLQTKGAVFHSLSGMITAAGEKGRKKGLVLVISAGTADMPVAEEAAVTASYLGSNVETLFDVGVSGIHRLLDNKNKRPLEKARAIIVVAGMEGALPSVVGGITDKPIIAVPTSIGYGTSLGGLTALFAMLNSCVPGIAVMNIDNGFGAGCLGHRINTI
jgi:NCAIR mutase (PurE)-related protein